MPSHHQITFIKKDLTQPITHQITHVGGTLANGTLWTIPAHDAITGIKSGRFIFTIGDDASETAEKVIVANSAVHGAFLRAESDKREPKRLMMLPEPAVEEENYY